MCLLANEGHLSDTQIFAAVCDNNRQAIVYENKVSPPKPSVFTSLLKLFNIGPKANFMCLPIPLQDGLDPKEHINIYNFSGEGKEPNIKQAYSDFFILLNAFNDERYVPISIGENSENLEVFQVGGYKCSLARTPKDILQLDPDVFGKPTGLYSLLNSNYAHDFAFLCCIFVDKSTQFHPILYTHPLPSNNKLFIPTRHYHGIGDPNAKFSDDWEHNIYVFGADPKSVTRFFRRGDYNSGVYRPSYAHHNWKRTQVVFDDAFSDGKDSISLNKMAHAMKIVVSGYFANIDFTPTIIPDYITNAKKDEVKEELREIMEGNQQGEVMGASKEETKEETKEGTKDSDTLHANDYR